MNTGASTFFPKRITIKSQDGREVDLGAYRRKDAPASPVVENTTTPILQTHQKRTSVIRMETVEAQAKRLAEEKEKEERVRKAEEEKRAAEEEKKRKEEEDRKKAEEEKERKKEEAERKKREAEQEAERERIRKEDEEKERIRKEEEAKKAAEEEERKRKEKEEEDSRKAAEAEKLRLAKEAEERRMKEEEKRVTAKLAEEPKPEEGEIIESPTSDEPPKGVAGIFSRKEGLKIDTSITKTRPGPLDLSGATKNVVPAPPSALATARIIEDLGHISYPEGVTSPKPELNVNSKKGKFRQALL